MKNFMVCCFMLLAVFITVTFFLTVPEQKRQAVQSIPEQVSEAAPEHDYILKEENGKLAVYATGENRPRQVLEVYTATLPEYDQRLLKQGLPIKDYEELLKRLEDYSS